MLTRAMLCESFHIRGDYHATSMTLSSSIVTHRRCKFPRFSGVKWEGLIIGIGFEFYGKAGMTFIIIHIYLVSVITYLFTFIFEEKRKENNLTYTHFSVYKLSLVRGSYSS